MLIPVRYIRPAGYHVEVHNSLETNCSTHIFYSDPAVELMVLKGSGVGIIPYMGLYWHLWQEPHYATLTMFLSTLEEEYLHPHHED